MIFSGYHLAVYLLHPLLLALDNFQLSREGVVKNGGLRIVERGLSDLMGFRTRNSIYEVEGVTTSNQNGFVKKKWIVKQARTLDANYVLSIQNEINIYSLLNDQKLQHLVGTLVRADVTFSMLILEFDERDSVATQNESSIPNSSIFHPFLTNVANALQNLHLLEPKELAKEYAGVFGFNKPLLLSISPREVQEKLHNSTDKNKRQIGELLQKDDYSLLNKIKEIKWEQNSLIHFDLKFEHIFCDTAGNNVKIYDWEMSDIGDRHWDVANILLEVIHTYIQIRNTDFVLTNTATDFAVFLKNYLLNINRDVLIQMVGIQILQRHLYGLFQYENNWLTIATEMILIPSEFFKQIATTSSSSLTPISIKPKNVIKFPFNKVQEEYIEKTVSKSKLEPDLKQLFKLIKKEFNREIIPDLAVLQERIYKWFYGNDDIDPQIISAVSAIPDAKVVASTPKVDKIEIWTNRWWIIEKRSTTGNISIRKASERRFERPGMFLSLSDTRTDPNELQNNDPELNTVNLSSPKFSVKRNTVSVNSFDLWTMGESQVRQDFPNWIRFYFHLKEDPEGIYLFIQEISKRLNERMIPFEIKLRNALNRYRRADAGILFVHRQHFTACLDTVAIVYSKLWQGGYLREEIPKFARFFEKGLGFGENPPVVNESFGNWRARFITEAITQAGVWQKPTLWLTETKRRFLQEGFNLFEMYRNPSTNEAEVKYRHDILEKKLKGLSPESTDIQSSIYYLESQRYLNAAQQIAFILCREAIWYGNQCNWIGFKKDIRNGTPVFEALNETERIGVGLFLAGVSMLSPHESIFRDTTLGATPVKLKKENKPPKDLYDQLYYWIAKKYNNESPLTEREKKLTKNTAFEKAKEISKTPREIIQAKLVRPEDDADFLADRIIQNFLELNIPFANAYAKDWNDRFGSEFCPTLTHGLACLGYFFLCLADQSGLIRPMPLQK